MKYEFKVDYEDRKIYFGEWPINHKGYITKTSEVLKIAKDMSGFSGSQCNGSAWKSFNALYDITPSNFKKVYNALWKKVWVTPIEKWAVQYGFTSTGKFRLDVLETLHDKKDELLQMEIDGNAHLIPFLVYTQSNPEDMKKKVGKGNWKKLCKNSKTRNKYLAKRFSRGINKENFEKAIHVPTSVLRRGHNYRGNIEVAGILCKHFKFKDVAYDSIHVRDSYNTINDTIRMSKDLGQDVNYDWSLRKWKEKHAQFTRSINARKYSPEPIDWIAELPEKLQTYQRGELKAVVLKSPLEIRTEGDKMHHCVGSYTNSVVNGDYLVYHIHGGGSGTTLGITRYKGRWVVQQHYGMCNNRQDVTKDHEEIAQEVVGMLNECLGEGE